LHGNPTIVCQHVDLGACDDFHPSSQAFSNCSSQQLLEIKNYMHKTKRFSALFAAAVLGAAGCSGGSKGDTGPAGPPGAGGGDVGPGGNGTITVQVTFANPTDSTKPIAAPGVYCFTNPDFTGNTADWVGEATSDASGAAVFSVPGGTYKFQCRPKDPAQAGTADYADDMAMTPDVTVAAGGSNTVKVTATRTNPLYFTTPPSFAGAKLLATDATVNVGATSVPATFVITPVDSKNVFAIDATALNAANGVFTVPDADAVLAGLDSGKGLWKGFKLSIRPGFVGLGDSVARSLAKALTFDVTATAGGNTTTARVAGKISGLQDSQGMTVGPIGVQVVADGGPVGTETWGVVSSYSWALTAADSAGNPLKDAPDHVLDAAALLHGATTRNPYFTPPLEGVYTLTNGGAVPPTVLTFTAAKYVGLWKADGTTPSDCHYCHDAYPQKFGYAGVADYWSKAMGVHGNHKYFSDPATRAPDATGAETIFQWGLQGVDYSTTCFRCHTTGAFWTNTTNMEASVDNGGFETTLVKLDNSGAIADGNGALLHPKQNSAWKGDGADHYTNLDPSLKALSGIQCESCHGPASFHKDNGGVDAQKKVVGLVTPFATAACAACHDAPGHHDKVELWSASGHANLEMAMGEAASETHPGNESCARCHAAQGFADYLSQQQNGGASCTVWQDKTGATIAATTVDSNFLPLASGNLIIKTPIVDSNNAQIGLTCRVASTGTSEAPANAAPGVAYLKGIGLTVAEVQPQTCATCHDAHSTELRVEGSTGVLPAGFSVDGAGAGALCMMCHNGRNGARGDGLPIPSAGIAAPHTPTQTEILMGQNFYWVNGVVSPHAAVADTCVGCHVKIVPASVASANDNHTFAADDSICSSCHGNGSTAVSPEALYGRYTSGVAALKAAMTKALGASFVIVGSDHSVTVTAATSGAAVTGVGRSGVSLSFTTPIDSPNAPTGTATVSTITVAFSKLTVGGVAVTTTGRMAKAGWNMAMLSNKSAAVHNPALTFQVLSISAQKLLVSDGTPL
jgi:hypothetical protein